jgi:hypothetical protein
MVTKRARERYGLGDDLAARLAAIDAVTDAVVERG